MSGFNRQHLGNLVVVSGSAVIMDPSGANNVAKLTTEVARAIHNDDNGGQILNGGVAFGTAFKNGEYPVFAHYDEHGNITSIEIKLDEDPEGEKLALEDAKS